MGAALSSHSDPLSILHREKSKFETSPIKALYRDRGSPMYFLGSKDCQQYGLLSHRSTTGGSQLL